MAEKKSTSATSTAAKSFKAKPSSGKSSRQFKPTIADLKDAPDRAKKILSQLRKTYPNAKCSLDRVNPLELLIATILSAQCTDKRVNIVTKILFKQYRKAADYAAAPLNKLEKDIRSTGFYRNKARNIKAACRDIVNKYNGKVPDQLDDLTALPGVGRKTANVVLGDAYDTPAVVTDTHVIRLSRLLGLSKNSDPVKLEFDLMKIIPKKDWTLFGHLLIFHGRNICIARKPDCPNCLVRKHCAYGKTIV